ncbi:hypothetical protein PM082_013279 [Marasmius tenuissimus]|nr:hypothetical protein PM082_013279 [Marasmius tenuissimus]
MNQIRATIDPVSTRKSCSAADARSRPDLLFPSFSSHFFLPTSDSALRYFSSLPTRGASLLSFGAGPPDDQNRARDPKDRLHIDHKLKRWCQYVRISTSRSQGLLDVNICDYATNLKLAKGM